MKKPYTCTLALAALLLLAFFSSFAQTSPLPNQSQVHVLEGEPAREETLSGIYLKPGKKGGFVLDFSQQLDENALLQVKDSAGKLVYQKPVTVETKRNAWRYQLGKLKPDTYLVEVKTSDTTYWTRFKISR